MTVPTLFVVCEIRPVPAAMFPAEPTIPFDEISKDEPEILSAESVHHVMLEALRFVTDTLFPLRVPVPILFAFSVPVCMLLPDITVAPSVKFDLKAMVLLKVVSTSPATIFLKEPETEDVKAEFTPE